MPKTKKAPSEFEKKLNDWVASYVLRVPFAQKILFIHNLYIMTKAGLSLVDALRILSEQISNQRLKKIIGDVKAQVEKAANLARFWRTFRLFFPLSMSV